MAEEMDYKMSESSLKKQAAALKAELHVECPRVDVVREIFDGIVGDVGPKCLRPIKMHETGLMEQLVELLIA